MATGAGTTGNAALVYAGQVNLVFDATAITAGDYVQVSTTVAGAGHDAGATKPTNGLQIIGRALASAAGSSTVSVEVAPDIGGYSSTTVTHSIGAGFDGGGVALTAGKTVYFTVPYACTIQAWNMTVDTGTATIDVWKIATGTAIPTVSNTITASAVPAISTGTAVHSTSMSGWTTSVSANDIFGINLKIVATATQASLVLQCQ